MPRPKKMNGTADTVRQSLSITDELLGRARSRAKETHGGNLSGYIQALIEKDLEGGGSILGAKRPLAGLVREVAPEQFDAIDAALSWVPPETLAKLEEDVVNAQRVVVEKVNRMVVEADPDADSDAEASAAEELGKALAARVRAQRKLGTARPLLNERELLTGLVHALAEYGHAVRQLAEGDIELRKSTAAKDPQFLLRNPMVLLTPEEKVVKARQQPVIIPKGLYDDMRNQIEASPSP